MTEREILLAAPDHEDHIARSAYLDSACAGRPGLRRRIEELLKCNHEDDTLLEVSAVQQLANHERIFTIPSPSSESSGLGRLSHDHFLEIVGRSATGMVLKARDSKLERSVAIKVLAPRLAGSAPARQRFVGEARAVAANRDGHVVGIHDVNDHAGRALPDDGKRQGDGVCPSRRRTSPPSDSAGRCELITRTKSVSTSKEVFHDRATI
jgi:hypothetical protein